MRPAPRFEMRSTVDRQGTPLLLSVSLHAAAVGTLVCLTSHARTFSAGGRHASAASALRQMPMQSSLNFTLIDVRPKVEAVTPPTPSSQAPVAKSSAPRTRHTGVDAPVEKPSKTARNASTAASDSNTSHSSAKPAVSAAGSMLAVVGEPFPDPAFLDRLVKAISQEWSPGIRDSSKVSEVQFTIHRDGSMSQVALVKASMDFLFNVEALGAVERVQKTGRIGALPSAWKGDELVVRFKFSLRKPEAP